MIYMRGQPEKLTANHNEQLAQNTNKQLVGEMFELLSKGSYLYKDVD